MHQKRGFWEHVLENNRALIKSSVVLRQFRCADPCMVKYPENQYSTGFRLCDSFPDGWIWYVLQQIIMRMENLCSRIGFYSTIVAISQYLDYSVDVFVNKTIYSGVIIILLLTMFSILLKIFCKCIQQNECAYLSALTTYRINRLPMF